MPIIELGMNPVPIDIDLHTLNISDQYLKNSLLGKNITMLFVTNALGFMPDYSIIQKICRERNILLIEDNCESLGSESYYVKSGNAGFASTFSFYVAHHLSTIEGGMVCTDNKQLYNMLRIVRANGWDRNLDDANKEEIRKQYNINKFYSKYTFYDLGYNLRPTEITGFLGLKQLRYVTKIIKNRELNYNLISAKIKNNNDIMPIDIRYMATISSFCLPFVFKTRELKEKYIEKFNKAGIETRPIIAGDIT